MMEPDKFWVSTPNETYLLADGIRKAREREFIDTSRLCESIYDTTFAMGRKVYKLHQLKRMFPELHKKDNTKVLTGDAANEFLQQIAKPNK